ncbi:MAG: flippase-like domain-containing protein [Coriobacteriales bacterium]|nr:flippase-like domain-containing protein [Coriobacteriales bacterium]
MSKAPTQTPEPPLEQPPRRKHGSIRNIIIGVIIILALGVILIRGDTFFEMVDKMKQGYLPLLILAFISQIGKYFAQSFGYSFAFRAVGNREMSHWVCFPLVFGAFFMNTIAPSLNIAGNSLFIEDAHRRGERPGHATTACLIMQSSIETGFLVVMIVGFVILGASGGLNIGMILAGLVVVVLVGAMVGAVVLSYKSPSTLQRILTPIEKVAGWFSRKFRKKELPDWAELASHALGDGAGELPHHKGRTASVYCLSVLASIFELGCFILTGLAFGVHDIPALLAGYVICVLFTMVAITPMGLGVVEAMITLVMTLYGVPQVSALAVALVFRGITFWLPFVLGTVLIHFSKAFKKRPSA